MKLWVVPRKALSFIRHVAIQVTFLAFEYLLPTRDEDWCFCTWQNYSHTLDNPRAVFEELKHDPSIRKIILQKEPGSPPVRDGCNVEFVSAESLRGAYHMARCRVMVIGYALRSVASYSKRVRANRHLIIQLWHGVPVKRIGHLFPGETFWQRETGRYDAVTSSSETDRKVMHQAFRTIPLERVWVTGLPRYDFLLKDSRELPHDYRVHLRSLDESLGGRKLVLYAPTWREDPDQLYFFSDEERERLTYLLVEHGAVLGIRGHSNVRQHRGYTLHNPSDTILPLNHIPDVSVVLRRTEILVTDYSGIYIDFLLTDRPILHFAYDLEVYASGRGFVHDPHEAFAGPCVRTFDALVPHLENALSDPCLWRAERSKARQLFHTHAGNSAHEVATRIRDLVNSDSRNRNGETRHTGIPR